MLRRFRRHLLLTAELSAIIFMIGTAVSIVANVVLFATYDLSFLQVATSSDVLFSGLAMSGYIALVVGFVWLASATYLSTYKFLYGRKSRAGRMFRVRLTAFLAALASSGGVVVALFILGSPTTYGSEGAPAVHSIGNAILAAGIAGIITGIVRALPARKSRPWIVMPLAILIISSSLASLALMVRSDDRSVVDEGKSAILLNGADFCQLRPEVVWMGSSSIVVTCPVSDTFAPYMVVPREGAIIGDMNTLLQSEAAEAQKYVRPTPDGKGWWELDMKRDSEPKPADRVFVHEPSIQLSGGYAQVWVLTRSRAEPRKGEPAGSLVDFRIACKPRFRATPVSLFPIDRYGSLVLVSADEERSLRRSDRQYVGSDEIGAFACRVDRGRAAPIKALPVPYRTKPWIGTIDDHGNGEDLIIF